MKNHHMPRGRRSAQQGLSIIELLVGFTVGLFIMGGAIALLVNYLGSNRKLLLETRVNQDLRTTADLVVRDLRRAGFWQNASSEIWVPNSANTGGSYTTNPYRAITVGTANGSDSVTFSYARDADDVPGSSENTGFRIGTDGSLEVLYGGSWQPVSDSKLLTLTMSITETAATVELSEGCPCLSRGTCTPSNFAVGGTSYATRPRATLSQFAVTLNGTSVADSRIVRSLTETVRVRNDSPVGTCPA